MAVKLIQNQDINKLEVAVNKALTAAKGGLRFHSLTTGAGMLVAVLETKSNPQVTEHADRKQPAAKPKAPKTKR